METMSKTEQSQLDSALFKKLEDLTMKIPNDPILYRQEIEKYSAMYKQQFAKLLGDIQRKNERFAQLLIFLARSMKYFSKQLNYIPGQVFDLLKNHGPNLHHYVRKKCVGSIMILRAKNILYPVETIQFLLTLFNIEDKQLRKILYKYIVNDIRRMNKHHKNVKINQQIRDYIYQTVLKNSDKMTQKSVQLMIDLYKRNIWTDNRCVNIISEGCFNQSSKIRMISSYFLIATTQPLQQMEDSDQDDLPNPSEIKFKKGIRKHTKNNEKKIQKQKKRAERRIRKKQIEGRRANFMPIDVIYSPQGFAQKLFLQVSRKSTKFSHKIVYFALLSRLIWRHKLIILQFYSHLSKYLEPKQKQIAKILTYLAQSIHENIPDDEIEEILKIIIQKFVNDKCSEYAMTVGLNTIRIIYSKLPGIITEDAMLYLATYHEYKNKNVSRAAKALINLVRQINPYLLEKKYRGRNFSGTETGIIGVSKQKVKDKIQGAELLQHQSDVPIYMDRILTDQDFKMIKKLRRKQEQEQEMAKIQDNDDEWEDIESQNAEEGEDEQDQEGSEEDEQQQDDSDNEQIDWEDCQELEQFAGSQQEDEQQDHQDEQQGSQQDEDPENQVQEQDQQQKSKIPQKKTKKDRMQLKKQQKSKINKKEQQIVNPNPRKRIKKVQLQSDSEDYQSSQDLNPNGFLNVEEVGFYKKSKTEIKAQRKANPEKKEKFKHSPKDKKGGGTTNKEKQKLKPLMMVRAKKNRIRIQQKQVKLTIKNLKNQLGKVRSGKQAKKMKNKKVTKSGKR